MFLNLKPLFLAFVIYTSVILARQQTKHLDFLPLFQILPLFKTHMNGFRYIEKKKKTSLSPSNRQLFVNR